MLRLKLLMLMGLSAAGQGIARLASPRLEDQTEAVAEKNALDRQLQIQRLQAELDRFDAAQRASQLRLKRLHAAREERQRATEPTEAMSSETLAEEMERLKAEIKKLREMRLKLRERRTPFGPRDFEPQRPSPKFERLSPPRIDDMPPLGPLAAYLGKLPSSSAPVRIPPSARA